jgi:hypothetical protein
MEAVVRVVLILLSGEWMLLERLIEHEIRDKVDTITVTITTVTKGALLDFSPVNKNALLMRDAEDVKILGCRTVSGA